MRSSPHLLPFPKTWGHSKKVAICKAARVPLPTTQQCWHVLLDLQLPETGRNKRSCLSHPVYGNFVIAPSAKTNHDSHHYGMYLGFWCLNANRWPPCVRVYNPQYYQGIQFFNDTSRLWPLPAAESQSMNIQERWDSSHQCIFLMFSNFLPIP